MVLDLISLSFQTCIPFLSFYNHCDSFQNNPRNQVSVTRSQFAYSERITCPERVLSEWVAVTLAEAQAANDSVRYSSRSALWSQFAYPERITHPERLLSEWVAVTLSGSTSSQ